MTGVLLLSPVAFATDSGPVASWKFDEAQGRIVIDSVTAKEDAILRNFWYLRGISGTGIKFDGFTTHIIRKAEDAPRLRESFTIEAWIAPQAYPYNWCAIVNQQRNHRAGYFFGIDDFGRVGLHLAIDGKWHECTSEQVIPFMTKWSHIAGTFSRDGGITVYIDGKVASGLPVKGRFTPADDVDLQIGRNHKKTKMNPKALVRPEVNFPTSYSFDGIIDELKIYDRALTADEIKKSYRSNATKAAPARKWRKLPSLPKGSGKFGATYCRLKFYPEWDMLWRVGDHPDIVVNFDGNPYQMVFWCGTNYNMNLVTENGKWVADQSAEGGGGDVIGCCEHMSDKHCRYAHVRLIENHDARVVVHWRYAVCDVRYKIANMSDGWGAWADEYYYIYPDGIAVRAFNVHGMGGCSITEPASLNNPGERAEDNLNVEAAITANMQGQIGRHSYDPWPNDGAVAAPFDNAVPNANISVVNFKSKSKPFYIYEPGTRIIPYGGGLIELRDYSKFPTWNHWPVGQAPSDGRYAFAADRVSSSAVTSPEPPMTRTEGGVAGRFIMGLTNKPVEKLSPIARSWLQSPEIRLTSGAYTSSGYSLDQRAFILAANRPGSSATLELKITATEESPVVNPAFVIKDWGQSGARLKIDGRKIKRGGDFRFGHYHKLNGSDLIVWIKKEAIEPITISLSAVLVEE
jgi:hypothetical protein